MGSRWIKAAVLYFLLGVGFGIYMHATVQLQWGATHAHINVVGWLTTAIIGVIYSIYPKAGNHPLGVAHFWLYQISLPVLLFGMFAIYAKVPMMLIQICVWFGGSMLAISIILFIINVYKNVHSGSQE
ncbi:hypothetical protein [Pontibacillus litoralis]|uniref:Cytochrome-c oxidase n=1 Tax=Pontibacillus litoralis JSM 072002 TaxID=1385512 RepID=A0A0A5G0T6_9BACI|nr:hypothetical protein [Pontibacillus litoralis]KGX86726.1 hypothetical protein N784_03775 [Pontibacillus litoralis JSM 072002]